MDTIRKIKINIIEGKYKAIDAYKIPKDPDSWYNCPNCNLKPLVWEFDNGRSTACGCGESIYRHFSIRAESIMDVFRRENSFTNYESDQLRKNWNGWVESEIDHPNSVFS